MKNDVPQQNSHRDRRHDPPAVLAIRLDGIDLRGVSLPTEPPSWPACFTPAEIDIARRLIRGESRDTIARTRATSTNTVAAQIRTMLDKLGVGSASALVAEIASGQR